MKLDKFIEHFNYASLELYEFAEEASKVIDAPNLKKAAKNYLEAKENFNDALDEVGVEIG